MLFTYSAQNLILCVLRFLKSRFVHSGIGIKAVRSSRLLKKGGGPSNAHSH